LPFLLLVGVGGAIALPFFLLSCFSFHCFKSSARSSGVRS
jgi:hypothetical protein